MTKSELRKVYLDRRMALSKDERSAKSRQISEIFFACIDLAGTSTLHCFIPIEKFGEVDTMPIFTRVWDDFRAIHTSVPRVDHETGEIENVEFTQAVELTENAWGIREPASGRTADPLEIGLVLVPLVCFDSAGHRVGYGKGFYDRFLVRCRPDCLKVGLSFFPPVEQIKESHLGDVRLDMCITPECVYRFP